jgi:hypothetical protein
MKKLVRCSIALLAIIFFIGTIDAAPVKRVLLEQHTGAWCGWCVDGTVVMEDLLTTYPDQVIGCKFHNGDAMVIPEQAEIGNAMGLTGFPTGSVDRTMFGSAIFLDRGNWKSAVTNQMDKAPKCDVELVYSLDPATNAFVGTVKVTMLANVSRGLKYNIYILEDSCSGTGSQWDQSNYYSNNSNFPTHPYYSKPSKIIGYQHMKTVRACLGGSFGLAGDIPNPAVNGAVYKQNFKYTLNASWKKKDLLFVGIVQADDDAGREIFNCAYGTPGTPDVPKFEISSVGSSKGAIPTGTPFTKSFTLKNTSGAEVTTTVTATKSTRTPADWTVEIVSGAIAEKKGNEPQSADITIPAGGTKDFTLKLTPVTTKGFGDASITVADKNDPNGMKVGGTVSAMTSDIEKFQIISSKETAYNRASVINNGTNDFFDIDPADFTDYASVLNDIKVLVWNAGEASAITTAQAAILDTKIKAGIPVVILSNTNSTGAIRTSNLFTTLNLGTIAVSREGYGQAPYSITLQGFPNDPISGDFGTNVAGNLISYLLYTMRSYDKSQTTPIIAFNKSIDSVLAYKIDLGKSKAVYFGFNPSNIADQTKRNNLIKKALNWVLGATDVDDPSTIGNSNLSVGPNPVETSSTVNYTVAQNANVRLSVFNLLGQEVVLLTDGLHAQGNYNVQLNAAGLTSGSYRLVMTVGANTTSIPVSIVK